MWYIQNKTKFGNKHKDYTRDSRYYENERLQKRICLSQNTYKQLIDKETTIKQLQQQIEQLKSESNNYIKEV